MREETKEWLRTRDLYKAAIAEWGWDDPRTIALEKTEAEACQRHLLSAEV